ncbi:helix-turn-helix domain-containing protein [Nostoc sp. FACHB-973]|uniref:Helix-turn-helix domain-containing protein n=1 Tax=Desmonostoc muscorum LEGE 12446 TaxID=1828758 RepID=A0A8J7DF43_DESMC|nr:helix-turn-helix domain-containing protein [Nostoc sp. FACHB-973]MBX9257013.1 helix-turn-helix domain-containing protein [Desmonostoc muscorum CCALA 125]
MVAAHLDIHEHTVRATLRRWENLGLSRLWEAP